MILIAVLNMNGQAVAKAVADELGIDFFLADVLPENRDASVHELQMQGCQAAMVGDGVNAATALPRADIVNADCSGTDAAAKLAGFIVIRSNPLDVVKKIHLSSGSYRKMMQNKGWAAGYHAVALTLVAGSVAQLVFCFHRRLELSVCRCAPSLQPLPRS